MSDDIGTLTDELARDPDSLVFLELGEKLRGASQLEAAERVVKAGIERHPKLAIARELCGRILAEGGNLRDAYLKWSETLVLDSRNLGARKGLGFLCFKAGDFDTALDHLEVALSIDPTDPSVVEGLKRVRRAFEEATAEEKPESVFAGFEGADDGIILADERGLVLGGGVKSRSGKDVSEQVAAYLIGISDEASRTTEILNLGEWRWVVGEATLGNVHMTRPTDKSVLMLVRDKDVPSGRVSWIADRAVVAAKKWLDGQGL